MAEADVLVFRDTGKVPSLLTKKVGGKYVYFTYTYMHPKIKKNLRVVVGRLHSIDHTNPPSLNFQPVQVDPGLLGTVGVSPFKWAEEPRLDGGGVPMKDVDGDPLMRAKIVSVSVDELQEMIHETDGLQDLWWLLSNRDDLLKPTGGDRWGIGYPEAHAYFLRAGGVSGQHLVPTAIDPEPNRNGLPIQLEEGWFVNIIRRGRKSSAWRGQQIEKMYKGLPRADPKDWDLTSPQGFHPIMRETQIKTAVYTLLQSAARDQKYKGAYRGMAKHRYIDVDGNPKVNQYPDFHKRCLQVVVQLCDQVDLPPTSVNNRRAIAMGYEARGAVLQALEEAQLGRAYGGETAAKPLLDIKTERSASISDFEREVIVAIAENDKTKADGALAALSALVDQVIKDDQADGNIDDKVTPFYKTHRLKTLTDRVAALVGPKVDLNKGPKTLARYLPIQPTDTARVALEVIRETPSWRIPRYDNRRERVKFQGDYYSAVTLWAKEAAARRAGVELSNADKTKLRRANASLDQLSPGRRLTKAILDLAPKATGTDKSNNVPRANDDSRAIMNLMLGPTLLHLCKETKELYDWKTKANAPLTPLQRRQYAAATRVFRGHVAKGLLQGVSRVQERGRDRRFLAQDTLTQAGYGQGPAMQETIDRLFTVATMGDNGQSGVAQSRRMNIRQEAIKCLTYLAMLRGTATDSPEEKINKRQIAASVLRRLQYIAEDHAKGFAGSAEVEFLKGISEIGLQSNLAFPPNPAEAEVRAFIDGYKQRMRQLLSTDQARASAVIEEMEKFIQAAPMGENR